MIWMIPCLAVTIIVLVVYFFKPKVVLLNIAMCFFIIACCAFIFNLEELFETHKKIDFQIAYTTIQKEEICLK